MNLLRSTLFFTAITMFGITALLPVGLSAQDTWQRRNLPDYGAVEHVVVTPEGDIFAQIFFLGMYRSTDDGRSWSTIEYFGSGELGDFISDDNGVLYITDAAGNIVRSLDDGATWEKMPRLTWCLKLGLDSHYRMYILTRSSGVYWSDDSGRTLNKVLSHTLGRLFITKDDYVFGYSGRQILRSFDRGQSWEDIYSNIPDSLFIFSMCSDPDGNLYAGGEGDRVNGNYKEYVLYSTNNGDTWTETNYYMHIPKFLGSVASGNIVCVRGPNGFVNRSTDYGETWHPYLDGMDHNYNYTLTFTPDGRAVTGSGGCIYITKHPVTGVEVAETTASFSLAQSYPNPVTSGQSASVQFSLPNAEHVTLVLYNMNGQRIATLAEGRYNPGAHTVPVATAGLVPGVYVYRLLAGDKAESKMLLVR
jgi:photosystem II stability/assembly factor-like uncharacterized protein